MNVCVIKEMGVLTSCLGLFLLLVESTICSLNLRVIGRIRRLLRRLPRNLTLRHVSGPQPLQLLLRPLLLNNLQQLNIPLLRLPLRLDLCKLDPHIQLRLPVCELRVRRRLFGLTLGLEDGGFGVDLGDFLLGLSLLLGLANFSAHTGFGHVNFGLVRGAFVGFAREEGEVFASRGVLEFFDVGIVT
jgi:hypothetical protein